jgi:hypothetical protein
MVLYSSSGVDQKYPEKISYRAGSYEKFEDSNQTLYLWLGGYDLFSCFLFRSTVDCKLLSD